MFILNSTTEGSKSPEVIYFESKEISIEVRALHRFSMTTILMIKISPLFIH